MKNEKNCNHKWGKETVVTEPTCYNDGYSKRNCTRCGIEDSRILPAGHQIKQTVTPATASSQGHTHSECTECGFVFGDYDTPKTVSASQLPFTDIAEYEDYSGYVAYTSLYNKFITGSNPPVRNMFSPKDSITRAMFVTILYRMVGEPYKNANPYKASPFTDIKDKSVYYYDAACWALDKKITTEKTFKPYDAVTRQQTATFLFRYAKENNLIKNDDYLKVDLSQYPDYEGYEHRWLNDRFVTCYYPGVSNWAIVVCSGSKVYSDDGFLPAGREYALPVGSVNKYNLIDNDKSYGKINIYATGRDIITYNTDGSLQNKIWSGNSAAAPLVSSICALMLAANPNLTPDEIENILYEIGNTIPSSSNNAQECITANAYEALKKITGKSLEKVSLDYSVNYGSDGAELTFFTDDPNAVIYYNDDNADFKLQAPFADSVSAGNKEYTEPLLYTDGIHLVTACAYAPGKAKSELEIVMISDNYKRNGYGGFEADDIHPYNYVADYAGTETTVEVPEVADGWNIEEIGDFCFA